ncbi:MAG TPA: F0F1 ATP synthase subunit delta [Chloroflexota bacterium]
MPASASARRYAAAAFSVAAQQGDFDAWLNPLTEFTRILQMPSARTVFASPAVPTSQKRAAIERLLPNTSPTLRNFLRILAERDRLNEVPGITEALRDLINQHRGIIIADVTTAVPLDADMERLVAERLATYLNRDPDKVTIRGRVDPSIIGGVVARVGDRLIDDSVRGRLERLRRTLAGSTR